MNERFSKISVGAMVFLVVILVFLVTAIGQAIVTEPFVNPHGGYGTGAGSNTALCAKCHVAHNAREIKLMRLGTQRQTCYNCHDGSNDSPNIRGQFGEVDIGSSVFATTYDGSFHPVPTGVQLCSDCHDAHAAPDSGGGTASLLAVGPQKLSSGNDVCGYCHGTGSTAPGGDILTNYVYTSHDTGLNAPSSNTGIKCSRCHQPHGSTWDALLRTTIYDVYNNAYGVTGNNNTVCSGCHLWAFGTYQGDAVYTLTYHGTKTVSSVAYATYPGTSYAGTICLNCHDVHGKYDYADYRRAGDNTLCTNCHEGKTRPSWYSYQGITAYNATPHANITDIPAKPTGDCSYCHAPHGKKDGSGNLIAKQLNQIPETVCFSASGVGCHSDVNGSIRRIDIEQRLKDNANALAHHGATQAGVANTGTKCTHCHDPHLNDATDKTVDPDNRNVKYVPTNSIQNYVDGSGNIYFQVKAMHDGTPPAITNVNASATDTGAIITWNTAAEISTGWVVYDTVYHDDPSEYLFSTQDTSGGSAPQYLINNHTVTVSANVVPGVTYYYRVVSVDALMNQTFSTNKLASFRAQSPPPAPVLNSPLTDSSPGQQFFNLGATWSVVYQDSDPIEYWAEVVGYGVNSGWTNNTSATFALSNMDNVTYSVRVQARNKISNRVSAWSNVVSLTHSGPPSPPPPDPSCPFIYVWDGQKYVYVTDAMNKTMGLGPKTRDYPLEVPLYVTLAQAKQKDGKFPIRMREVLVEADYIDTTKFYLAEHLPGYQVVSSTAENYLYFHKRNPEKWYTIKDPVLPKSAVDSDGKDVLEIVSKVDGKGIPGVRRAEYDVTLDFGQIKNPQHTKLVFEGWNDGGVGIKTKNEHNGYAAVINDKGQWEKVKEFGFFSGDAKTIVVELGDVFKTKDHRIRVNIGTMPKHHSAFDRIRLDNSVPVPIRLIEMPLEKAVLSHRGYATNQATTIQTPISALDDTLPDDPKRYFYGYFTKYGEVTPLLQKTDDMFVIMRHGDQLDLTFGAEYTPRAGMAYTPVMMNDLYYKIDRKKMTRDVEPLPFHAMSDYPYPKGEHYPDDKEHRDYQKEWNTRYYAPPAKEKADDGFIASVLKFFKRIVVSFENGVTRFWRMAFGEPKEKDKVAFDHDNTDLFINKPVHRVKPPEKLGQYHYSLNTNNVTLAVMLPSGTTTYTVNSVYAAAWESAVAQTPSSLGTSATPAQISSANASDASYWITGLATAEGSYNSQVYRFTIAESKADVDTMIISWKGYGEPTASHPTVLSLWNFSTNQWNDVETLQIGTETTLSITKSRDFITYCNKCHDNNVPSGVIMGSTRQISPAYNTDNHGSGAGPQSMSASTYGWAWPKQGSIKQPYARNISALSCGDCHDPHGSTNLYHLKENVNGKTGIQFTSLTDNAQFLNFCTACHNGTFNEFHNRCLACHTRDHEATRANLAFTVNCIDCHKHGASTPPHGVGCGHCTLNSTAKQF